MALTPVNFYDFVEDVIAVLDADAGASAFILRVRDRLMRGVARALGPAAVVPPVMIIMFGRTTRREQPALCEAYRQRFLAAGIRGSERVVVPRAEHLSALEAPEPVTRAIERFLDRLESTGRSAA